MQELQRTIISMKEEFKQGMVVIAYEVPRSIDVNVYLHHRTR